jgi:hypothetical protein
MGADYSFGMDNSKLLRGFLRLRNGGVLFMITAIIMTVSGILYPLHFIESNNAMAIVIWFIEMINFIFLIIASTLILTGINIISKNVNDKNDRLIKITRILLLIFLILYSISTFILSPFVWIETEAFPILIKNLIVFVLLTAFLLTFSFSFQNLQKIGYGTRLLYVPLIFLTVPSFVGLILGCISLTAPYEFDADTYYFGSSFLYLYLTIFLFFTFLEMSLVLRRMTKLIDKQVRYVMKSPETEISTKTVVPTKK